VRHWLESRASDHLDRDHRGMATCKTGAQPSGV
jgi:hypothetical protein